MSNREEKGRIHSIETFGAVDGPGIRFVVFLQGCPLRCLYCHNPDSWNVKHGTLTTVGALMDKILDYRNFLSGGLTISGGEPMVQGDFVYALLQEARLHGIHSALDTSGAFDLKSSKRLIDASDMLLLDIKAATEARYAQITQRSYAYHNAYATLDYCESVNKPVWIRHVLLNGYTLNEEELRILAKKLSEYKCIEEVDLLPFHKMGEYKWGELGYEYKLFDAPIPSKEDHAMAKEIFSHYHYRVK